MALSAIDLPPQRASLLERVARDIVETLAQQRWATTCRNIE